jgi:hypothetical protein
MSNDDETRAASVADVSGPADEEVLLPDDDVRGLLDEPEIDRNAVRRELAKLKDFVQQLTLDDLRDGDGSRDS